MLEILSCNCDDLDRDIVAELKDLSLEYNSEFVNLSEKQKNLVIRFLQEVSIK